MSQLPTSQASQAQAGSPLEAWQVALQRYAALRDAAGSAHAAQALGEAVQQLLLCHVAMMAGRPPRPSRWRYAFMRAAA